MIRPATSNDCIRVFRLLCSTQARQRAYASFEQSYEHRLHDDQELCMISEDAGRLTGFIAFRAGRTSDAEGKTTITDMVLAPCVGGMSGYLIAEAGRLASALGFDPLVNVALPVEATA